MTTTKTSWIAWWPLGLVLLFTNWLYQPILKLFWYRDDYALLYWLMHPEGPINPADIGDFKLPIYHGLLDLHWPAYQLFGLDVTMHRAGQLVLLLLVVTLVYWLAHRLSRSHLVATATSALLATSSVGLSVIERVSLSYQAYVVVALMIGVVLLLVAWRDSKRITWLWGAGVLFLVALFLVGVRLHAAFLGIGAMSIWLTHKSSHILKNVRGFVGVITLGTLAMVLLGGLGRNELALAPTILQDILGSIGNLFLPSTGTDALFDPVESDPAGILLRYRWLVGFTGTVALLGIATLTDWKHRIVQSIGGVVAILVISFLVAIPDVSAGDRTLEAETWLAWLAGGEILLLILALGLGTGQSKWQQLMLIGLGWAIVGFLPAFLVQPGAPFGTTDKYFISSVPGLILFWIGALSGWVSQRQWLGLPLVIVAVLWGGWLIRADLAMQQTDRALPATTIHAQLKDFSSEWPTNARIVLLAKPSSPAAFQLHEAFAASTIRDEAIFTVLYGLPYDTRRIRLTVLEEVVTELSKGSVTSDQIFVYGYGPTRGLIDLTVPARSMLPVLDASPTALEAARASLLLQLE